MPKDPTEKKEKKEKREKKEKKKKEVVEEAAAEVPTTDIPEDATMDSIEDTEVDFPFTNPRIWFSPIGLMHISHR